MRTLLFTLQLLTELDPLTEEQHAPLDRAREIVGNGQRLSTEGLRELARLARVIASEARDRPGGAQLSQAVDRLAKTIETLAELREAAES